MKNRFLKALVSVFLFPLLLSSCSLLPSGGFDEGTHKHTFESGWTYNEFYHWHAATCGHKEVDSKERHTFVESVFEPTSTSQGYTYHRCTVCDYVYKDNYVDPSTETIHVGRISLNKTVITLYNLGQVELLNVSITPENATNKAISWRSVNPEIATVDSNGVVKSINYGETEVIATSVDSGLTATCHVRVMFEVNTLNIINKYEFDNFHVGDFRAISIEITPERNINQLISDGLLKITSSDTSVASITGLRVNALSEGTTVIGANLFGYYDSFTLHVLPTATLKEKYGTVHIGTIDDPLSNEDALIVAKAQESEGFPTNSNEIYIRGEVASFYSSHLPGSGLTYCSFFLKPEVEGGEKFEAYKIYKNDSSLWAVDDIWVGAIVTFRTTRFANYMGQYEVSNGTLVIVEGDKPAPQQIIEATVAEALAVAGALADGDSTYDKYAVEGYITEIIEAWNPTYVNISFKIADVQGGEQTIDVFRCTIDSKSEGTDAIVSKLIVDAKVRVTGVLTKYVKNNTTATLRFAQNGVVELIAEAPTPNLAGIYLNVTEKALAVGDTYQLAVLPIPTRAELAEINWSSSNQEVAVVDESGIVTALSLGTANITATCGQFTAAAVINVIEPDGFGTKENPISTADARNLINYHSNDGMLPMYKLTVSGVISKIESDVDERKVFWLQSPNGEAKQYFKIQQAEYENDNNALRYLVGAQVTVTGYAKFENDIYQLAPTYDKNGNYISCPCFVSLSYDGYIDMPLSEIKYAIACTMNDPNYDHPFDNQRVHVKGTVSSYNNNTLYIQDYYIDDYYPELNQWAGVQIFCGMSAVPTKFTTRNTYIEVYGLLNYSEEFGYQITDTQGKWKTYGVGDEDCKVLLTPEENTGIHNLVTYQYTIEQLNTMVTNRDCKTIYTEIIVNGLLTCNHAFVDDNRAITLSFDETDAKVYIPFAYHGDSNDPTTRWDTAEQFEGRKFRIDYCVVTYKKSLSDKIVFQLIPINESSLVWINE